MKFTSTLISTALSLTVSAISSQAQGVDPTLVPEFSVIRGVNRSSTGDCNGVGGIRIPCSCPPDRTSFIASLSANVAAGHATNNPSFPAPWPTDPSVGSEIARVQTCILSLQNLFGPGKGCPAESTIFGLLLADLQSGTPSVNTTLVPDFTATATALTGSESPALAHPTAASSSLVDPYSVPSFDVTPGVNPTPTGDCDGINGTPIPCSCPPDRTFFIEAVSANVAAGHATNNPSFSAPWPTDDSAGSQITRLQTSILTIQNLFGPGVGCPVASTDFLQQLQALTG
ncbi:hypothetical protein B0H13DRAFT_2233257 [Mycena leptocephala]|nr:hypothetical protein B0H13DRAFT_2233257 [Mycena leptocephala]